MTAADLHLARRWISARVRLTLRNPRAVIFTFVMPLLLLVLLSAPNAGVHVAPLAHSSVEVRIAQFYAPAMAVFALVTACYTTLILGLSNARDSGLFKRVRGTPLPMPIYLGSWATGAALVGLTAILLIFLVAVSAFGVDLYPAKLPLAVAVFACGAFALTACGMAVASLVKNAEQAMPVAQMTFLPIAFISGLFFPLGDAPGWLTTIAGIFPLYHLREAFTACFVPGAHVAIGDLAVVLLWGAVALRVATLRFGSEVEESARPRFALRGRA